MPDGEYWEITFRLHYLLAEQKEDRSFQLIEKELQVINPEMPQVLQPKDKANMVRWVSGRIEIPLACGDRFYYTLQDFGRFSDDGDEGGK